MLAKVEGAVKAVNALAGMAGVKEVAQAGIQKVGEAKAKREIAQLEKRVAEYKYKIGDYYWRKHSASKRIDKAPKYFCQKIDEVLSEVERLKSEAD